MEMQEKSNEAKEPDFNNSLKFLILANKKKTTKSSG